MQKSAGKVFLSILLVSILILFVGMAQAQENSTAGQAQASATPYNPAAAAFATPAPKPARPAASEGPDPDRKWEVEFHGGGAFATNPDGGSSFLPAPGTPFTTVTGPTSRAISSYYFGDGTLLYNQAVDAAGFVGITAHIVPLDPILTRPTANRNHGAAFGLRASRDISPRWAIEVNLDYSLGEMELNSAALAGIEASRASWATAWGQNLSGFAPVISSVSTIHRREGHQLFGTAGANVNLLTEGRLIPYLSFGGGALANTGDLPSAALVGNFSVTIFGIPHNNTDAVLINWEMPGVQGVGYVGGGVKYYVTPRWGIRFDVRDYLSANGLRQTISAVPDVRTLAPGGAQVFSVVSPTLQLSNNPAIARDTLSGPVLNHFRTFSGDGIRNQIVVSGGVFLRF